MRISKSAAASTSVSYGEALESAICFGWIDGQKKALDESHWLQKFTPRRARSVWSKKNTENALRLIEEGRMRLPGLREVEAARQDGRWQRAYESPSNSTMPDDFLSALERDSGAKAFFETLNKRNTYAIAYRIQSAKKPETRERRIKQFVEMLSKGEKLHP